MWNPKLTATPLVLVAALGLAVAAPQDPEKDALKAEVEALESRVDSLEAYVKAQGEAAKALSSAVDQAVEAGFTSGINFKSREILVEAWKAAAKAQSDTGIGKAKDTEGEGQGGRR